MDNKKLLLASMVFVFALPLVAFAGHHYGGYGCMGKTQNMTDLETDGTDGLSFEEFTAPAQEKWRSGFNMIDTNDDGTIDADEYGEYLEVHGWTNK